MDRKYQIFISSTYQDLIEERREAMRAVLNLGHIPAGMELFPAADDDSWTLIKEYIEDCDYYVLVLGGRYGSTHPDTGKSFTEMEYDFAVEREIPILAFLPKDSEKITVGKTDQDQSKATSLLEFSDKVRSRNCSFYEDPASLCLAIVNALVAAIRKRPGVGWLRANQLANEEANREILQLQRQVDKLKQQVSASKTSPPPGTEKLEQGDDVHTVLLKESIGAFDTTHEIETSWDEIFGIVGPPMLGEEQESRIADTLRLALYERAGFTGPAFHFKLRREDFHRIIVQLEALGLTELSSRSRSVNDQATYWTLTGWGRHRLTQLLALQR